MENVPNFGGKTGIPVQNLCNSDRKLQNSSEKSAEFQWNNCRISIETVWNFRLEFVPIKITRDTFQRILNWNYLPGTLMKSHCYTCEIIPIKNLYNSSGNFVESLSREFLTWLSSAIKIHKYFQLIFYMYIFIII